MRSGPTQPFPYGDYVEAQRALHRALAGPRFYGLLVGPTGMGKTTLARELSAALDRRRHQLVYVASSRASLVGLVRLLAHRLHLRSRRCYLETVDALASSLAAHSVHLLLWLDEAHQLDAATLGRLRSLVEADLTRSPLLSVVLSGLPALHSRLEAPGLLALRRRIDWCCTLAGLRRDELLPFVEHCFGAAAAERLPAAVHDELFERTQAAPALLERVIRHALHRQAGVIDAEVLRAILDEAGL